ncbi:MAG TPA: MBL fold metallo-hydrolase [Chitinophagaceae bacterium]|nr:MBL fold metallo-hydrolase [Chitinophagaceae bacterium]
MLSLKAFTFNPVQENTYLLYNEQKECCIIDPGCYFQEERDQLKKYIAETGLKPVLLLNTHCHFDHVFGNKFVFETWGLIPHLHDQERPVLEGAGVAAEGWQLPFDNYEGEIVLLAEGDNVRIGEDDLQVSFTPGHSPGSISFYSAKNGMVMDGDVLFNMGIGRTDLGGDYPTLIKSIQTKLFVLPDETRVYSGHGPVTTIGFEKMNNAFLKMF